MGTEDRSGKLSPWILFPEIIGVSIIALLLPLPLSHMLASGQTLAGAIGFVGWFVALFFAGRFIRRRQYGLVLLPMAAMLGFFFVVQRLCQ